MSLYLLRPLTFSATTRTIATTLPKRTLFSPTRITYQNTFTRGLKATSIMANTTAPQAPPEGQFEWLVIIPDFEGALSKRMEVRPKHFEGLTANVESGFMKMGGAILEEVPKEGEALKFNGSSVVCVGSSREEVLGKLKKDIYVTSGVWDIEKAQIFPFKCALRLP